jgi:hypothetical protein
LSAIYNWFTKGFDTKGLQEATVLLLVIIPKNKDLPRGTLSAILQQAGLSQEEFLHFLEIGSIGVEKECASALFSGDSCWFLFLLLHRCLVSD